MTQELVRLQKTPLGPDRGQLATIVLNRAEKANAFNKQVIVELSQVIEQIKTDQQLRLVLLKGEGKHFSAGADLEWMQESSQLTYEDNLREAQQMSSMFTQLKTLAVPTIAVVQGAVYGGGVGLCACCDLVVAAANSRFCLSEVKLGLLPAVILPFLKQKMSMTQLKFYSLTGESFDADKAMACGLVYTTAPEDQLKTTVTSIVASILNGAPMAQRQLKQLSLSLENQPYPMDECIKAIANARHGAEGQSGLSSFFNKQKPKWQSEYHLNLHL